MSRTDRGQLSPTPIPIVFMIVVVVMIIVAEEVMSVAAEESVENVEHLCNGFWGCGGPPDIWGWAAPFLLVLIGVVCISVVSRDEPSSNTRASSNSGVTYVKEQYVKGDVETVIELEELLEDEIDDPWGEGEE